MFFEAIRQSEVHSNGDLLLLLQVAESTRLME